MAEYMITYNEVDRKNNDSLLGFTYENISGKNPKDAVEKRFGKKAERVYGDDINWKANVIVQQATFDAERNVIKLHGNGSYFGYKIMEENAITDDEICDVIKDNFDAWCDDEETILEELEDYLGRWSSIFAERKY